MRLRALVVISALAVTQAACASYGTLTPVKGGDTERLVREGRESLVSNQSGITVILSAPAEKVRLGKRADFILAIRNGTQSPFEIATSNVTAHDASNPMSLVALKVFTYDELVEEEKERQAWAALAAGLSAMGRSMQAANAGYQYQSGSVSTTAYGPYGTTGYGYGTYSGTTYNYGAAQAAQMQADALNQAEFDRVEAEGEARLSGLRNTILKRHTVLPGEWYGGTIKVAVPDLSEEDFERLIGVSVAAQNTVHEFRFRFQKVKK